jgi:hypothetical protein
MGYQWDLKFLVTKYCDSNTCGGEWSIEFFVWPAAVIHLALYG